MKLTQQDIDDLRFLENKVGSEWSWVKEKRNPVPFDFGLSDNDVKIITDPYYNSKARNHNKLLTITHYVISISYFVFWVTSIIFVFAMYGDVIPDWSKYIVLPVFILSGLFCLGIGNKLDSKTINLRELEQKYSRYKHYSKLISKKEAYDKEQEANRVIRLNVKNRNAFYIEYFVNCLAKALEESFEQWDSIYWMVMNPWEFEEKVCELYSKQFGYSAYTTPKTGDGGVDVIIKKDDVETYVQCKHYSENNRMGVVEVRAFWGACAADNVNGIIVCTSSLTQEALDFVNKLQGRLEVVGLDDLVSMSEGMEPDVMHFDDRKYSDYLLKNYFWNLNHCYVMYECFLTKQEAKEAISRLDPYPDYRFCFKVMQVMDEYSFLYYLVVFVESRYSSFYENIDVNLDNDHFCANIAKLLVDREMENAPQYCQDNQTISDYFNEYDKWRETAIGKDIFSDDVAREYKKQFMDNVSAFPLYKKGMLLSEYLEAYNEYRKSYSK